MKRREFLKAAGGILAGMASASVGYARESTKRPNILFIMSDDHAAPAIGAYGKRFARLNPTPNLDKLAAGGLLFENCFCTNSICSPSRANLLTGQYTQTNGVLILDIPLVPKRQYLPIPERGVVG